MVRTAETTQSGRLIHDFKIRRALSGARFFWRSAFHYLEIMRDLGHLASDEPASITALAIRLHRDRCAVKKDVSALEHAGLVSVETCIHPGHGRMKEVRALAEHFVLEAHVA